MGSEREIMIYTPRLYEESPQRKYEVVYVFDAQARQYFDFVHSSLTFLNSSVPMIVVGVTSPSRDNDFLPEYKFEDTAKMMRQNKGEAHLFIEFINTEVFNYVEANYRTLPTRLAIGHSNGGVFLTYCLLNNPNMFNGYLAISPHMRYDRMQMIDKLNNFDPDDVKKEIFFYMCKGNESGKGWKESIVKTKSLFESEKFKKAIHFKYEYYPDKTHSSVIPVAVLNGLESWFTYQYNDFNKLKEYYLELESNNGYVLSEQNFIELVYDRYCLQDYKLAKDIFDWSLEKYPNSKILKSFSEPISEKVLEENQHDLIFPEKCIGVWEGTMLMYNQGVLRDSVKIRFTAARTEVEDTFIWKTEYLSKTTPIKKDYKLIVDNEINNRFILDEGEGIELIEYNVNNKLQSLFKVGESYLTSTTELVDDKLIFEVTSGKMVNEVKGIKNFAFDHVQRAEMYRIDK